MSYLSGYGDACDHTGSPQPHDPLDRKQFTAWLQGLITLTPEHESRLNAWSCLSPESYAQFISVDDSHALDTLLSLREEALKVLGGLAQPQPESTVTSPGKNALDNLPQMLERPAMYFGNDWHISDFWAYYRGYTWCEQDHGTTDSDTFRTLTGFQEWMDLRYPFATGFTWDRTLYFIKIGSSHWALESFAEHLSMYRSGMPANATDPTMKKIISSMIEDSTMRGGHLH